MGKVIWIFFSVAALVSVGILGCGHVKASSAPNAVEIMGPSGFTCFAVMSGDQAVGGNCIKD